MAELILDDLYWTYRNPDNNTVSSRRLRVWATEPGRLVAILTERDADEGMSITNAAVTINHLIAGQYPDHVTDIIEHYPASGSRIGAFAEHFDLVNVVYANNRWEPQWRRLKMAELITWIGVDPSDPASTIVESR